MAAASDLSRPFQFLNSMSVNRRRHIFSFGTLIWQITNSGQRRCNLAFLVQTP